MNDMPFVSRKERRKRKEIPTVGTVFGVLFCLVPLMVMLYSLFIYFRPAFAYTALNTGKEPLFYYSGELSLHKVYYEDGRVYLPLDLVKEEIDPFLVWDSHSNWVICTTTTDVYHFKPDQSEGLLNLKAHNYLYWPLYKEGTVYFPADMLQEFYGVEIIENEKQNVISIHNPLEPIQTGRANKAERLRAAASFRSPWVAELAAGERVSVLRETGGWFWVRTGTGMMGYIRKSKIELCGIENSGGEEKHQEGRFPDGENRDGENVSHAWRPLGKPLFLTWEFVGTKTSNPDNIEELAGINVISPTWFELLENGIVQDKADKGFIDWAHSKGRKVWGVFSNGCQIDLTHTFLSDASLRIKAIGQLAEYAEKYNLDGIDVDFEYMYMEDKAAYVQFMRELTPILHQKGVTVTVYLIFHSNSENWSLCYDHRKLGEISDYAVVMAYDQHTVLSGSVASLSWVERGIRRMLEDVPAEKLILGVPLYTRLWKEETGADGKEKTSRFTLTMEQAEQWVADNSPEIREDAESGQHYVEIKEDGATYRMWLEDFYSLEKRVALVKKYRLAGLAAWRRGVGKEEIWPFLTSLLDKRW